MSLDLSNDWVRYDGSSASNVYYGYASGNPSDSDFVFAIRKVNSTGSIQNATWTNNDPNSFCSTWNSRTYSFTSPTGNLNFQCTYSNITSMYVATFTWSSLVGVNKYLIKVNTSLNGWLLTNNGYSIMGQYAQQNYTANYTNVYSHTQILPTIGATYTVMLTAINVSGQTSSTLTISI